MSRDKPRFIVKVYRPDYSRGWDIVATYRCGSSIDAARRTAHDLMASHGYETTRYSVRPLTWFASIMTEAGRCLESIDPEETLVPSVGELGWTP